MCCDYDPLTALGARWWTRIRMWQSRGLPGQHSTRMCTSHVRVNVHVHEICWVGVSILNACRSRCTVDFEAQIPSVRRFGSLYRYTEL